MHVEAVMTQLVFEHALRIRLHAPSAQTDNKSVLSPPTAIEHTDTRQPANETEPEPEVSTSSDTTTTTTTLVSENIVGKAEALDSAVNAHADSQKSRKSLIGTMTNLVTTDLSILKAPCAYLLDCRQFKTAYSLIKVDVLLSSVWTSQIDPCHCISV